MLGIPHGSEGQAPSLSAGEGPGRGKGGLVPRGVVSTHWDGAIQAPARSSVREILCCLVKHCSEAWREGVWQTGRQTDIQPGGGGGWVQAREAKRSPGWGGGRDEVERAEGTHRSSEEGLVWAQLLSERFGKTRNASSQFPQIPFATRTPRTLLPDSCPSPSPAPPTP